MTFTKTFGGDVTKADLSNITFTITGPKGFTTQTVKLSGMTKGNDGKYTYTLDNLEWGTYTVKETNSSVNGYTLDKTSHIEGGVTVDAAHLEGDANTINLTDNYSPVHPRVQLFKNEFYNGDLTGNPVGGASYALYRYRLKGSKLALFANMTRADVLNASNWEYLGEDNTDGTGFVCSKDELNEGDIVAVMEMKAPAGYQRTANPAIVQVHANANPTLLADADGAVSLDKDGNLQWKETVVRIGIKKVDANGNAVVGAKMAVLDKDGKVIDTWTTTKDNLVHETDKLTAGETYTLRELQAPEGYEKAADVTFTAEAKDIKGTDEYVQSVTMIDQKSQPAKPGTPSKGTTVKPAQTVAQGVKTGDPTTIGGLVLMLAAAGAVLVLSAKHLKAMR
ncbi:MSCRAMM family protein [Pseudoramibacter sp.]|uniref:MSCRAMM family protein n=1 Tax=Pseudoramibacter sp. TaxID=2034862 RepID=UPI0025F930BB|nr:SpaA isopeptide-forming pilin-related protein [Pseudoramibacter sp.]